jgi:hypothetical protein
MPSFLERLSHYPQRNLSVPMELWKRRHLGKFDPVEEDPGKLTKEKI